MTLNELKYIVAVSNEKHFRKAAEKCFVSQPTLSVAIKKLEEELEVVLFERQKQDILITPVGKKIIERAREILTSTESIKQIAKESHSNIQAEFKIGAIYTIAPYLFPKLIPAFQSISPNTPLIIEENFTHVLAEKLQSGEIDVAILALPFAEPNIETLPLYTEPFKAIVPNSYHAKYPQNNLTLKTITDETILLLGAGHCFRDQVIEAFPNLMHLNYQSHELQKTFVGSSLETIRYMVSSGAGISIFPCSSLSERDKGLFTIKTLSDPVPTRIVALAWRKTFPRKAILELFQQALSQVDIPCTIPLNT